MIDEHGEFLRELNQDLMLSDIRLRPRLDESALPTVFIIGPPRSGTTLLCQLLAHFGGFGYVSNFVARFWLAPYIGTMLQQNLLAGASAQPHGYKSRFGRTEGLLEPHEFGYFWTRWFGLGQEEHELAAHELQRVDVVEMKRSLACIEHASGMPMVFSNNTWCTFQVEFLATVLSRSLFVVCDRDPLFVAQSILQGRLQLMGAKERWWSVKPRAFRGLLDEPWWMQIAGQVYYTIESMNRGLSAVPSHRIIRVSYAELCQNPRSVVRRVVEGVNAMGGAIAMEGYTPASFDSTDGQRVSDSDFARLEEGVARYFKSSSSRASETTPPNA